MTDEPRKAPPPERLQTRARNICLYRLSRSAKTEQQLRDILTKKDIPDDIINDTLTWLRGLGYVDDARYAADRAAGKSRSGSGRRAIAFDLRNKGIPADLVAETVDAIDDATEEDNAYQYAVRKHRTVARLEPHVQFRRIASALARRGYAPNIVFDVTRRVCTPTENDSALLDGKE